KIDPFVIAGHTDHRRLDSVEAIDRGGKHIISAERAPALDVYVEYRECDLRVVDLGDQRGDLRNFTRGVREVTPQSERELRLVDAVLVGRTRVHAGAGGEDDRHGDRDENSVISAVLHNPSFVL